MKKTEGVKNDSNANTNAGLAGAKAALAVLQPERRILLAAGQRRSPPLSAAGDSVRCGVRALRKSRAAYKQRTVRKNPKTKQSKVTRSKKIMLNFLDSF